MVLLRFYFVVVPAAIDMPTCRKCDAFIPPEFMQVTVNTSIGRGRVVVLAGAPLIVGYGFGRWV